MNQTRTKDLISTIDLAVSSAVESSPVVLSSFSSVEVASILEGVGINLS